MDAPLDGLTLAERLTSKRISLAEAISIGVQLAEHLAPAHAAGIVMRALTPSNVLLVDDATAPSGVRATLLAFRVAESEGAPEYMAPEQFTRIEGDVDGRADLYALGVLLFEAITGRLPFFGPTRAELIGQHLCEPPPRLRTLVHVPRALDELLVRLLAKRRDARPRTAEAVAYALRAISIVAESRASTVDDGAFGSADTMPFAACA